MINNQKYFWVAVSISAPCLPSALPIFLARVHDDPLNPRAWDPDVYPGKYSSLHAQGVIRILYLVQYKESIVSFHPTPDVCARISFHAKVYRDTRKFMRLFVPMHEKVLYSHCVVENLHRLSIIDHCAHTKLYTSHQYAVVSIPGDLQS